MRIVIAGQTYYPGNNGQAIFTIHLAEGLARAGHDVHVLSPGKSRQYTRERIQGVTVHSMPSAHLAFIHPEVYLALNSKKLIRRILSDLRPDIVHIQDHYFLCRDVTAVAREMQITTIGTNHFLPENVLPYLRLLPLPRSLKVRVMWDLMLMTYNRLKVVTTPTETAAGILRKQKIHPPVFPVSCGVDTRYFTPDPELDRAAARSGFGLDPQSILLVYIGRLDPEKRVDLLLSGLAELRRQGMADVQLAVGGQGSARAELEALASSLGIGGQARFLGYVPAPDLPKLYQCADIFCMPSPEELQSIATLEAMACARPVLAANARALPELVAPGMNGLLFEPGSVNSAAQAMLGLVEARAEWERMGWASRSRAAAHSLENTIGQYEALYRRVGGIRRKDAGKQAEMRLRPARSE